MASMCDAAIGADIYNQRCNSLRDKGFEMLQSGPLVVPVKDVPLAWKLIAVKA